MDSSDHPNQENFDEAVAKNISESDQDDDHHHQSAALGGSSSATARSYECTFCKRGFSNAQALGGHMNIHRKDKAKLKQSVPPFSINHETRQQPQQSLEIPKILIPSYSSSPNPNWFDSDCKEGSTNIRVDNQIQANSIPIRMLIIPSYSSSPNPNWFDYDNEGSTGDDDDDQVKGKLSHDRRATLSSSAGHHSSSDLDDQLELDLELRLGREPQHSSSTSLDMATRKFF